MFKLLLWEAIMLSIMTNVMLSSRNRFCVENNIDICDYSKTDLHCCLIIIGYFIGKLIMKF